MFESRNFVSFASEGMTLGTGRRICVQALRRQNIDSSSTLSWKEWRVQWLPPQLWILGMERYSSWWWKRVVWVQGSKSVGGNSESRDSQTDKEQWNATKTSHSIRWHGNKIRRRLLQVLANRRKKPGAKLWCASPYSHYFKSLLSPHLEEISTLINSQWQTKLGFVVFSTLSFYVDNPSLKIHS